MFLWWNLRTLYLHIYNEFMYLVLRHIYKGHKLHQKYILDVSLVEFMSLVGAVLHPLVSLCTLYLQVCQASYRRQLRSMLLYLCYVFPALINSLVCWFCKRALGLVLFQNSVESDLLFFVLKQTANIKKSTVRTKGRRYKCVCVCVGGGGGGGELGGGGVGCVRACVCEYVC